MTQAWGVRRIRPNRCAARRRCLPPCAAADTGAPTLDGICGLFPTHFLQFPAPEHGGRAQCNAPLDLRRQMWTKTGAPNS